MRPDDLNRTADDLRAAAELQARPATAGQAPYDLRRLAVHGLIARSMACLAALVLSIGWLGGCTQDRPYPPVEGESLEFTVVKTMSTGAPYGDPDALETLVLKDDGMLAACWGEPGAAGGIQPREHIIDGDAPDIPGGVTAVWFEVGLEMPTASAEVQGVYASHDEWTIAVRMIDLGPATTVAVDSFPAGILFVEAPPPGKVRVRFEDQTGGSVDGQVIWGEPATDVAVCQPTDS
ncbi:MAG: hypothetical protein LBC97_15870 [Bifidobacteriaceae bacterium]|jgi:hypothetical protein|nr:hypothetical protein [Bifidobacteriaceae bacterium]